MRPSVTDASARSASGFDADEPLDARRGSTTVSHCSQWPTTIWCGTLVLEVAHLAQPLEDRRARLESVEPGELAARSR